MKVRALRALGVTGPIRACADAIALPRGDRVRRAALPPHAWWSGGAAGGVCGAHPRRSPGGCWGDPSLPRVAGIEGACRRCFVCPPFRLLLTLAGFNGGDVPAGQRLRIRDRAPARRRRRTTHGEALFGQRDRRPRRPIMIEAAALQPLLGVLMLALGFPFEPLEVACSARNVDRARPGVRGAPFEPGDVPVARRDHAALDDLAARRSASRSRCGPRSTNAPAMRSRASIGCCRTPALLRQRRRRPGISASAASRHCRSRVRSPFLTTRSRSSRSIVLISSAAYRRGVVRLIPSAPSQLGAFRQVTFVDGARFGDELFDLLLIGAFRPFHQRGSPASSGLIRPPAHTRRGFNEPVGIERLQCRPEERLIRSACRCSRTCRRSSGEAGRCGRDDRAFIEGRRPSSSFDRRRDVSSIAAMVW